MDEQKYYWIKLKTDFFDQQAIDLLLSQPNGCQYVVLYQMLCLSTANNGGEMATRVGEMIVPYNVEKIVRDTKYFDHDTVVVALELFKRLGLVYEEDNGILKITDCVRMVGSESATREAIKKREQRLRKKLEDKSGDKLGTNCPTDIEIDIRYRDKILDKDKDIDKEEINKEEVATQLAPSSSAKRQNNSEIEKVVVEEWNKIGLASVQSLSKTRKAKIRLRVQEQGLERVVEALRRVPQSRFLMGDNKQGWKCSFDWIFSNDSNIVKVLEGNYEDNNAGKVETSNPFLRSLLNDRRKEEI